MRSVNNTWMQSASLFLWVTAFAILSGCASANIPDVQVYKTIPFVDAPELVSVTTVSHKDRMISAKDSEEIFPILLCVDDEGWAAIKKGWLEACRFAGKNCNIQVDSVSELIQQLDDIARKVYQVVP